jgi:sulfite dehydrogenase (cytochrome) subunit B
MKLRASTLAMAFTIALASTVSRAGEESIQLKEGAGREITAARCTICHSLDYIEMAAPVMQRPAWEKSVRKMIDAFGAPVSEEDARVILNYLSEHYSS